MNGKFVLRNFVPLIQFKKREKHPRKSNAFSKVVTFLNCINSVQFLNLTQRLKYTKFQYFYLKRNLASLLLLDSESNAAEKTKKACAKQINLYLAFNKF